MLFRSRPHRQPHPGLPAPLLPVHDPGPYGGHARIAAENQRRTGKELKRKTPQRVSLFLEVPPRFELGVELLQSSALPLGYGTVLTGYAIAEKL